MSSTSIVVGHDKGASSLEFPLFNAGQMLYHQDLSALAEYTRQMTRLMLRSLFGCGVVCGLCVKASIKCCKLEVEIEPGVALDCEGDLIHVPKTTKITVDPECDWGPLGNELWVVLRGYEKCCAPRATACSCDDDEGASACTRERYWYEIQVRRDLPKCVCRCCPPKDEDKQADDGTLATTPGTPKPADPPCQCADPNLDCYRDHYEGRCACACPDCKDCGCEWILLAKLTKPNDNEAPWEVEHRVRRFVRPVLVRDRGCCDKTKDSQKTADETTDHDHETAVNVVEAQPLATGADRKRGRQR